MQSKNRRKITALDTEADIVLDLVETVVRDMRGYDEGKINIHRDCRKVW